MEKRIKFVAIQLTGDLVESEKPRRSLRFKAFIIIVSITLFCVFWFYILPILTAYEKLELFEFYGWTTNSTGQVKQASFIFFNNGTKELTLSKVLVNGTILKSSEWGWYYSSKLDPHTGERVFVALETTIFKLDKKYNFTIETSRGNHFPFILKVEEDLVQQENLTIKDLYFNIWPPDWDRDLGIAINNYGNTPAIVTQVTAFNDVDDKYWKFEMKQWFFPGDSGSFIVSINWREEVTYYVSVETATGNIYEFTKKAVF